MTSSMVFVVCDRNELYFALRQSSHGLQIWYILLALSLPGLAIHFGMLQPTWATSGGLK